MLFFHFNCGTSNAFIEDREQHVLRKILRASPHRPCIFFSIFWLHIASQSVNLWRGIMKSNQTLSASLGALMIVISTLISGCANTSQQAPSSPSYPSSSGAYSESYGTIDSIQLVSTSGNSTGVGAVVGGVVGGLLGNQVGGGSGRTAATAAGVIGGAVVGNEIEKNKQQTSGVYQIGVRLENGGYHTVSQESISDLRVGDRVPIQNDRVYRY